MQKLEIPDWDILMSSFTSDTSDTSDKDITTNTSDTSDSRANELNEVFVHKKDITTLDQFSDSELKEAGIDRETAEKWAKEQQEADT